METSHLIQIFHNRNRDDMRGEQAKDAIAKLPFSWRPFFGPKIDGDLFEAFLALLEENELSQARRGRPPKTAQQNQYRRLRKEGFTQKDAAEECGVSLRTAKSWDKVQ